MPLSNYAAYKVIEDSVVGPQNTAKRAGETIAPQDILRFLARLRMLEGVPFNTIVPDTDLLPNESIRFFYLDRAWTDALIQGALSVATANTIERAQLEKLYPEIEQEIDDFEKRVRSPGSEPDLEGTAGVVSGFLLRSAAVAGWPGMHVRAYKNEPASSDTEIVDESHPSRIKLLRLERLSPSVLLAMFDGVPKVLHIEEPRQGLQFGFNMSTTRTGRFQANVPARNVRTSEYVNSSGKVKTEPKDAQQIPVRFRPNVAGVMDLSNTARAFASATATKMSTTPGDPVDGAEFAMQMIRFPYRQVFAHNVSSRTNQADAFKPTLGNTAKAYTKKLQGKLGGG